MTFVQRFGSSLNLNVHLHVVVLDGYFGESYPSWSTSGSTMSAPSASKNGEGRCRQGHEPHESTTARKTTAIGVR